MKEQRPGYKLFSFHYLFLRKVTPITEEEIKELAYASYLQGRKDYHQSMLNAIDKAIAESGPQAGGDCPPLNINPNESEGE